MENRPVNEWCTIALVRVHTQQYLFRCAIITHAKVYMVSESHANTSAKELIYPLTNNSFATSSWVPICRNPLHYIVFTSKQISVSIAQKHSKWVLMSSLPVCLLKHPCKQCILSLKYQFYRFFLYSVVIISNPAIFLQIFNFTLITCHRIIKRCFGMWQPYVQSFFKRQTWEGLYVWKRKTLEYSNMKNVITVRLQEIRTC